MKQISGIKNIKKNNMEKQEIYDHENTVRFVKNIKGWVDINLSRNYHPLVIIIGT